MSQEIILLIFSRSYDRLLAFASKLVCSRVDLQGKLLHGVVL